MKSLISCCLIFFSCFTIACAQQDQLADPIPYFMAIIVSDVDTSINWYDNTLGFEVLNRVDMSERGLRQANLKHGDAALELIELSTALSPKDLLKGKPKKTKIAGLFKFGFAVNDFDEWAKFLTDKIPGLEDQIVNDPNTGKKMVIILDPDGNRIQLFEK